MIFDLLPPIFELYSVYALWFTCSQILTMFCLYSLVYFLPDFSYVLFILFGLLAPRFWLYSVYSSLVYLLPDFVYALWFIAVYALRFTCSQILAIFCLCSLVYFLFMLFGLLAPRFWL